MSARLEKLNIGSSFEMKWEDVAVLKPAEIEVIEHYPPNGSREYCVVACQNEDRAVGLFHMTEGEYAYMKKEGLNFGQIYENVASLLYEVERSGITFFINSGNNVSQYRLTHNPEIDLSAPLFFPGMFE